MTPRTALSWAHAGAVLERCREPSRTAMVSQLQAECDSQDRTLERASRVENVASGVRDGRDSWLRGLGPGGVLHRPHACREPRHADLVSAVEVVAAAANPPAVPGIVHARPLRWVIRDVRESYTHQTRNGGLRQARRRAAGEGREVPVRPALWLPRRTGYGSGDQTVGPPAPDCRPGHGDEARRPRAVLVRFADQGHALRLEAPLQFAHVRERLDRAGLVVPTRIEGQDVLSNIPWKRPIV